VFMKMRDCQRFNARRQPVPRWIHVIRLAIRYGRLETDHCPIASAILGRIVLAELLLEGAGDEDREARTPTRIVAEIAALQVAAPLLGFVVEEDMSCGHDLVGRKNTRSGSHHPRLVRRLSRADNGTRTGHRLLEILAAEADVLQARDLRQLEAVVGRPDDWW